MIQKLCPSQLRRFCGDHRILVTRKLDIRIMIPSTLKFKSNGGGLTITLTLTFWITKIP